MGGIDMAGKYEVLTKYIDGIGDDSIGEWFIDKGHGTIESPIQMPYVNYSELIYHFMDDVFEFAASNNDMELDNYKEILNENGIEWEMKSMTMADAAELDARCVMALIGGAIRAERFCEGALLTFWKKGIIRKWLLRLKALDE